MLDGVLSIRMGNASIAPSPSTKVFFMPRFSAPSAAAQHRQLERALAAIHSQNPALGARSHVTADPRELRDESPETRVSESLISQPHSIADVILLTAIARSTDLPLVPRGGRTGLVGGCVPQQPSIIVDTSEMVAVETLDIPGRYLKIGPGATLGEIDSLLQEHDMMYPPDPASFRRATIGGTVATNAGGLRCVKYGVTANWVRTIDLVLSDGSFVTLGHPVIKDATGFDLTRLLVGSEGTLGIIVGVGVAFCRRPAQQRLFAVAAASIAVASEIVATVLDRSEPSMCELLDAGALRSRDSTVLTPLVGESASWGPDPTLLLIEYDAAGDTNALLPSLSRSLQASSRVREVPTELREGVLEMRRGGSAVRSGTRAARAREHHEESLIPTGDATQTLPQDISVPISRIASTIADIRRTAAYWKLDTRIAAHAGDGNLHLLLLATSATESQAPSALTSAMDEIVTAILRAGGTVSGEHGIGTLKRGWASRDLGDTVLGLHTRIKQAFDPAELMNPHTGF